MDYSLLIGINDCKLSAEAGDDSDSESIEGLDKNGYVSSDDGLGNLYVHYCMVKISSSKKFSKFQPIYTNIHIIMKFVLQNVRMCESQSIFVIHGTYSLFHVIRMYVLHALNFLFLCI